MLTYRSPISVILLSLFTCGIYPIYFVIVTQDAIKANSRDKSMPSGFIVFLLSIITCGIYSIFWIYQTSIAINEIMIDNDLTPADDVALNTVLGVFLTPICFYAILQTKINTIVYRKNGTI